MKKAKRHEEGQVTHEQIIVGSDVLFGASARFSVGTASDSEERTSELRCGSRSTWVHVDWLYEDIDSLICVLCL